MTLVAFIDGLKCTTAKPFLRNSHLDSGNSREYRKAYDPFDLSSGTQQKPTEKDAEFWKKDMASIGLNTKFNPLLRNYGSIYSNNSTDDEIKVVSNKFKLSKHHICSSEYFEFAFWKIFWFTMSCIVCSLYWLTKFPKICGLPFDTAQQQRNMILLNRLGEIAIIAVLFGWLFWLCEVDA